MTQVAAQRQTVAKEHGIPAIRSTTSAVIIKNKAIVQNTQAINEKSSKKRNNIITAALNIFAKYNC